MMCHMKRSWGWIWIDFWSKVTLFWEVFIPICCFVMIEMRCRRGAIYYSPSTRFRMSALDDANQSHKLIFNLIHFQIFIYLGQKYKLFQFNSNGNNIWLKLMGFWQSQSVKLILSDSWSSINFIKENIKNSRLLEESKRLTKTIKDSEKCQRSIRKVLNCLHYNSSGIYEIYVFPSKEI